MKTLNLMAMALIAGAACLASAPETAHARAHVPGAAAPPRASGVNTIRPSFHEAILARAQTETAVHADVLTGYLAARTSTARSEVAELLQLLGPNAPVELRSWIRGKCSVAKYWQRNSMSWARRDLHSAMSAAGVELFNVRSPAWAYIELSRISDMGQALLNERLEEALADVDQIEDEAMLLIDLLGD